MSQAHFFESLGLLAQAEQEWRLALDSKPNGKPADLGTRCSVWHSLGGVMRRRACERYGVPPTPAESGQRVWRAGTVMAQRAERECTAESERDAPKTWEEIYAHQNAQERMRLT